ncbi:hypothetical protein [Xanthomonas floridensis]|uniref:Acetyltransferase n=1 Tax=Xanthomonas floridensis TaxID=1843580 RepID=A0A1A9M5R5_9XANT|nr:hypothetical protein [Xanthomonas floridensis]MEA5123846.1 hypothetical protein [Xanthomonas floridensis]MEA5131525.1 hypothetical protein [Xanthomonas floridensis]OAG65675.1 hypothetical protein A7D17_08150 [Xanthomonas floridensis]
MQQIRPYRPADLAACLALFDGNTPGFFTAEARGHFARYLRQHAHDRNFQVMQRGDAWPHTSVATLGITRIDP